MFLQEIGQFVKDSLFGWMPDPWKIVCVIIALLGIAVWYLLNSFQYIPQGSLGMRTRFGEVVLSYDKSLSKEERRRQKVVDKQQLVKGKRAIHGRPKYRQPGIRWMMPLMHRMNIVDVRDKTMQLKPQNVLSSQTLYKGILLPQINLTVGVEELYLWTYKNENVQEQLAAIANTRLGKLLKNYSCENFANEQDAIDQEFRRIVEAEFEELGATVEGLYLGNQLEMAGEGWQAQAIASLNPMNPLKSLLEKG